jgi:hypothetical protein
MKAALENSTAYMRKKLLIKYSSLFEDILLLFQKFFSSCMQLF